MSKNNPQQTWQDYLDSELPLISNLIKAHGYILDGNQPHIKGERFLMQAITTTAGRKIILYGRNQDNVKVVIKATRDKSGKEELRHERTRRTLLHDINFAYDVFHSPKELHYIEKNGFIITITEFITQTSTFLERPLEEQFSFLLTALKAQEKTRATTGKHIRTIKNTFNYRTSTDYVRLHQGFLTFLERQNTALETIKNLKRTHSRITNQKENIEQYCGFLTHTDFVPHNLRIKDNTLYLLDFSSLQFGNKHESWARLLNFMTLYNRDLEKILIDYVEQNRAPEELQSLQLMRLFRLGEIITYYTKKVQESTDDLQKLNHHRISFWSDVLAAELNNQRVSPEIVVHYQNVRDKLRSPEEKERQVGLH